MPILLRGNNSGSPTSDWTRAVAGSAAFAGFSDGQRIAQQSTVAWFPLIVRLVAMVVVAYQLSSRGRITGRGIVAFGLAAGGVMAFIDGFMLGVTEESRARYGRVSSGVVVEKFSSSGAQGTRRIGRRGGRDQQHTRPVVTAHGFAFYDSLSRLIVTGSAEAWAVDYRFPCAGGRTCARPRLRDRGTVVAPTRGVHGQCAAGGLGNDDVADRWQATVGNGVCRPRHRQSSAHRGRTGIGTARTVQPPSLADRARGRHRRRTIEDGDEMRWRIRFA